MNELSGERIRERAVMEQSGEIDSRVIDAFCGRGVLYSVLVNGERVVLPVVGSDGLWGVDDFSFVRDEQGVNTGVVRRGSWVNRFSQVYGYFVSGEVVEGAFDEFGFWDSDIVRVRGFDDGCVVSDSMGYFSCRGEQEYRVELLLQHGSESSVVERDVSFVQQARCDEFMFPRGIGLLTTMFVRREYGFELLVMERSDNVAIYPGRVSTVPNGVIDMVDIDDGGDVVLSCFSRELEEEVFGGDGSVVDSGMFELVVNGVVVDGLRGDLQIISTVVVDSVSDSDVVIREMRDSFEGEVRSIPVSRVGEMVVGETLCSPCFGVGLVSGVDVLNGQFGECFDFVEFGGWV